MSRRGALALLIVIATLSTGCTMWPEKKSPGWEQTTSIERMEQLYWDEIKAHNWKELEARTASNFTHTSPNGTFNKQTMIEQYKKTELAEFSLGDFEVVPHGETAVVSYTANYRGTFDGKTLGPVTSRRMDVWQQQKSGWVLIASSESNR